MRWFIQFYGLKLRLCFLTYDKKDFLQSIKAVINDQTI